MPYLKKSLGQHFLRDEAIQQRIADAIGDLSQFETVVEIGPGMGALTKYLVKGEPKNLYLVELDDRWAAHLRETYPWMSDRIINEDFLRTDLNKIMRHPTHVVGNFPYNISSQIVFKLIDNRDTVAQMTGMFQKEVALRLAAKPSTKDYGVLTILTQVYFEAKYLFDVPPICFDPPPKVMSGIVQLFRKTTTLQCDEKRFKQIVKQAFTMRRKTMRNSLNCFIAGKEIKSDKVFDKRPEELSIADFEALTNMIVNSEKT